MKKLLYIFAAYVSAVSCGKFLDEKPQSDLTKESLPVTELVSAYSSLAEAEGELNGAYALFKADIYEMENFLIGDVMSDNCYVGGDGVAEEQFGNARLTATNRLVEVMWSQYYAIAGSATNVVENVGLMKDEDIAPEDRARLVAEARFIRAWVYFDIVRLWGAAPMVLELIPAITNENLDRWYPVMYPGRTSEEEIYDQILEDLSDETIAALESRSSGVHKATKGAAYGLKAKVLATRGEKASRPYNEVIALCDKVAGEGYRLVQDFDMLWTVSGKQSSESIFELYFSDAAEQHNWAYWVLLSDMSGSVVVTWRRYCTPTHDLLAKFDTKNDRRYASSVYWTSVPYDTFYPAGNYPLSYKIRQKESDIILLRLADILLLKAEALVETGDVKGAIEIVNTIRDRAGLGGLKTDMGVDEARLAVENERQLELFMEGHRWYDLVRNGRWSDVMKKTRDKKGALRFPDGIADFRRHLPVPQGQIDINERLVQNAGY